jgi:flagellar assembly factor FliW
MKIKTDQFGEVEFDEDIVLEFKDGIIGFENLKKFILISEDDGLFYWLTSIEQPEIVFPLFPATLMDAKYPVEEGYEVFGIVKLSKDVSEITINLKAPIYISHQKREGFQKIIDNDKFEIDRKLFIESKSE